MRARTSYAGFISNKRELDNENNNSSNFRSRFRTADSPLARTIGYGIGTLHTRCIPGCARIRRYLWDLDE